MSYSLHGRLLAAASVLLLIFLGGTWLALDQAFQESAESALQARLKVHVYGLLSAAEMGAHGLTLPPNLADSSLALPGSGRYATVRGADDGLNWHSVSALGANIRQPPLTPAGVWAYERYQQPDGTWLYEARLGIAWELGQGISRAYTFAVTETLDGYFAEISTFRYGLWVWLGGLGLVLLLAQAGFLRWALAPLRDVATDLHRMETGEQSTLSGRYPSELTDLTSNLNALLSHERANLERYRNTLADLAHSLKTPLAVLRTSVEQGEEANLRLTVTEQVGRMTQMVDYQLQRAAVSGRSALAAPLAVSKAAEPLVASLRKVYHAKRLDISLVLAEGAVFYGDEGDLFEILGNLLDNACKWCDRRVGLHAEVLQDPQLRRPGLKLSIEDDGPGVPEAQRALILQRGGRADERVPGHGIGLAVVRELVELYGGKLRVGQSAWGGAAFTVNFPPR